MDNQQLFDNFSNGLLRLPDSEKSFREILWSKHPTFEGVELKHILTSVDTKGLFSYHFVRIAPNKSIKSHIHDSYKANETYLVIA